LFITAPFYVLLVVGMCSVFWLFWLSCQFLPSDWLESPLRGCLTVARGSSQESPGRRVLIIFLVYCIASLFYYVSVSCPYVYFQLLWHDIAYLCWTRRRRRNLFAVINQYNTQYRNTRRATREAKAHQMLAAQHTYIHDTHTTTKNNENINYCVRGGHKPARWPWPTSRLTEIRRAGKQEAQLMLTTGSTRLAVSRGQQTWYHSTCYI